MPTTGGASYAFFGIEDLTNNWIVAGTSYYTALRFLSGTYFPTASSLIVDVSGGDANYGFDFLTGLAWDTQGVQHTDPGNTSGSDPYTYVQQQYPGGLPYSTAGWFNGTLASPADPRYVEWAN